MCFWLTFCAAVFACWRAGAAFLRLSPDLLGVRLPAARFGQLRLRPVLQPFGDALADILALEIVCARLGAGRVGALAGADSVLRLLGDVVEILALQILDELVVIDIGVALRQDILQCSNFKARDLGRHGKNSYRFLHSRLAFRRAILMPSAGQAASRHKIASSWPRLTHSAIVAMQFVPQAAMLEFGTGE